MSISDQARHVTLAEGQTDQARGYVDWGAIFAGAAIASAITLFLTGFGTAVGLSMTSVTAGGLSGVALSVAAGLWVVWVMLSSLFAGSYITGRLRRRIGDGNDQEVMMRDGAHGLIVWAVSVLIGAMLAAGAISGAARVGAEVGRTAATAVGTAAISSTDYAIDVLVRGDNSRPLDEVSQQQISRILVRSFAAGQVEAGDRAFLTRTVATSAGVDQAEVERRIDNAMAQAKATADQAKAAADRARRVSVLVAFLTAAALALGAAAAWWGGSTGGRHRDENTDLATFMSW